MSTADQLSVFAATEQLALSGIGERLAPLRLTDPLTEQALLHSLQKYGQLTPLIACRFAVDQPPELLDGFKRLRVGRQLGWATVAVRPMAVTLRAGKAALVHFNRHGRDISGMEEALVVHSLCHEDGLTQVEIARLLGRHKSWVCRRLTLIERLSDEVQDSIRLGLLPASLGAELSRLQRCNQERLLGVIREHGLTWRETRRVVAVLLATAPQEHETILRNPRATVLKPPAAPGRTVGETRAQHLVGRVLSLEQHCREVAALLVGTSPDQVAGHEAQRLRRGCAQALLSLDYAREVLQRQATGGTP
jgi:ParB-like chromosome segregation protein Spo0J